MTTFDLADVAWRAAYTIGAMAVASFGVGALMCWLFPPYRIEESREERDER